MKAVLIEDENSFCKVVHYTHANPVHHGFTKNIKDWVQSSYKAFLTNTPTRLDRDYVLEVFGGRSAFIKYHEQPVDLKMKFPE